MRDNRNSCPVFGPVRFCRGTKHQSYTNPVETPSREKQWSPGRVLRNHAADGPALQAARNKQSLRSWVEALSEVACFLVVQASRQWELPPASSRHHKRLTRLAGRAVLVQLADG